MSSRTSMQIAPRSVARRAKRTGESFAEAEAAILASKRRCLELREAAERHGLEVKSLRTRVTVTGLPIDEAARTMRTRAKRDPKPSMREYDRRKTAVQDSISRALRGWR